MSRTDELIEELCPSGVHYQALGTLGRRNKGTSITASKMKTLALTPGPIRVFAGGQTVADVSEDAVPAKDVIRVPSIIVKSRGHIGFTYYDKPFTHKSELWSYSIGNGAADQKFVYYYLLTQVNKLQDIARATSVKLPQLSVGDTDKLRIPVPPIAAQQEIVRILDTFSNLMANLEAELEARKLQYEHYQHEVFADIAASGADWVSLRDVGQWYGGGTPSKGHLEYWSDGTIPWISPKDMGVTCVTDTEDYITELAVSNSSTKMVPHNAVAIVVRSSILNHTLPVAFVPVPVALNQDMKAVIARDGISPRYLFHALRSSRGEILRRVKRSGGSVASLDGRKLWQFAIPVPSNDEQERIVKLLDGFDTLVHDPRLGIPAELVARRKQYEYYRDRLLTFEETAA